MLYFKKVGGFLKKIWRFISNVLGIGDKIPEPEEMSVAAVKILVLFSTAMGVAIIASNLAALKIWELRIPYPVTLFPIKEWRTLVALPVDAGVWLFPLTYLIGDLLMNIYGQKLSNLVALYVSAFAVMTAMVLWLARYILPDFSGVDNSAFEIIQNNTGRIFLASIAGFLAGQLTNNFWFTIIRNHQTGDDSESKVRTRALISSIPAHFVDSVLFETLAFWGRVSTMEFVQQATFALVIGIVIEGLISWKLTPLVALKLQDKLQYSNGKKTTSAPRA